MGELVELVFESVVPATAEALLKDILESSGGCKGVDIDGRASTGSMSAERIISSIEWCATVRLTTYDVPNVGTVPDVALRLLKTREGDFDVEFNLDTDDVPRMNRLTSGLHTLAANYAKRHSISQYYAGLEPAADKATRIFTGEALGPLRFPGSSDEIAPT